MNDDEVSDGTCETFDAEGMQPAGEASGTSGKKPPEVRVLDKKLATPVHGPASSRLTSLYDTRTRVLSRADVVVLSVIVRRD